MLTFYFWTICSIIFISFLFNFSRFEKEFIKKTLLIPFFQWSVISYLFFDVFFNQVTVLSHFLFLILFSLFCGTIYTKKQIKAYLLLLKSVLFFLISTIFVISFYEWLFATNIHYSSPLSKGSIGIFLLCIIIFLLLEWLFIRYFHHSLFDYTVVELPTFLPISILILLIAKNTSLVYILLFSKHSVLISILFFTSIILEISFGIFTIIAIIKTYYLSIHKYKNKVLHMQYELQVANSKQLEAHQTHIRQLSHDLHNHRNVLYDLIQNQYYSEALVYLETIGTKLNIIEEKRLTNHSVLNALLNHKENICHQEQIHLAIEIQIPAKLPIQSFDLCIIVGNLFDNSIEASRKIPIEQRFIEVKSKIINENFVFQITNHYNGQLRIKNKQFLTLKTDDFQHGLGIQNVQATILNYNGSCHIEYTDSQFSVLIYLPL